MSNGNEQAPLQIDVTDVQAFRAAVVQHLQILADRTYCLAEVKKKVDKHERVYTIGKWAAIPGVAILDGCIKYFMAKMGS